MGRDILAMSIVMILTGLTLIVMRSRAIMQMVGLITMENGIYLLGMAMTEGLPLVIEMGNFFGRADSCDGTRYPDQPFAFIVYDDGHQRAEKAEGVTGCWN